MSQGLVTRIMSGRAYRLRIRSSNAATSEPFVRLLLARISDDTGVPARLVEVDFRPNDYFTVHAPDVFLDSLGNDAAIEPVLAQPA